MPWKGGRCNKNGFSKIAVVRVKTFFGFEAKCINNFLFTGNILLIIIYFVPHVYFNNKHSRYGLIKIKKNFIRMFGD